MPALRWSRRRLLSAVAVALAAVAGCANRSGPSDAPRGLDGPPEGAVTDVEWVSVRHDEPAPFVVLGSEPSGDEGGSIHFLLDGADADALSFRGAPAGAGTAREFVRGTDFDAASVIVIEDPVPECFRHHVDYVVPRQGSFDAELCHVLRDADVPCDARDKDMVASFIRVPRAYGGRPDEITYSSGSSCESVHWEETPPGNGTTTAASNDSPQEGGR